MNWIVVVGIIVSALGAILGAFGASRESAASSKQTNEQLDRLEKQTTKKIDAVLGKLNSLPPGPETAELQDETRKIADEFYSSLPVRKAAHKAAAANKGWMEIDASQRESALIKPAVDRISQLAVQLNRLPMKVGAVAQPIPLNWFNDSQQEILSVTIARDHEETLGPSRIVISVGRMDKDLALNVEFFVDGAPSAAQRVTFSKVEQVYRIYSGVGWRSDASFMRLLCSSEEVQRHGVGECTDTTCVIRQEGLSDVMFRVVRVLLEDEITRKH